LSLQNFLNLSKLAWGEPFSAISAKRGGSCTVAIGARGPKVEEPLGMALEYPIQWRVPRFDLAMLAKQRKAEKLAPITRRNDV
jgi:hypothetical protein